MAKYKYEFASFGLNTIFLSNKKRASSYFSFLNNSKASLKKFSLLKDVLLRKDIKRYGLRNSLLVAPMPTASTAQILGNYECFEPVMTNLYSRRVLAGDYVVTNRYMVDDLKLMNLWTTELKDSIVANNGSISHLDIPQFMKERYKTAWEIKQKDLIDMSRDRGAFICQSQSLNLFQENPTFQKLSSMHTYTWKQGLKTGIYYLRTRPSCKPIQFTVSTDVCESCSG